MQYYNEYRFSHLDMKLFLRQTMNMNVKMPNDECQTCAILYIYAEDAALLPPCGEALQSGAFKFKSSRLNDISRDLLGAATSCETPPVRASRNKPLQRKTQWIPKLFFFVCFF